MGKRDEIGKIVEAVFLHGKETPTFSHSFPEGQMGIAQAIQEIDRIVRECVLKENELLEIISPFVLPFDITDKDVIDLMKIIIAEFLKNWEGR